MEEITGEASKLKAGKTAGPDRITNTSIKLGFRQMQRYVFHLFNLCFAEHSVPRIWKLSYKPEKKVPANKGYQVTVECQNDCGMWTDIRVYTLEMKAQTELLDFACSFCAAKEIKKLKKQIESFEKASEKLEVTQSLDKMKETNQSRSNAVPSKLSFAEIFSGVNQELFEQKKRSKNLVLGTKPESENTEASDNRLVSGIAESLKVNMKFECQRFGKQNTEGKQLLRIKCDTEEMKFFCLGPSKESEDLKRKQTIQVRIYTTRSNKNRARK